MSYSQCKGEEGHVKDGHMTWGSLHNVPIVLRVGPTRVIIRIYFLWPCQKCGVFLKTRGPKRELNIL